MLASECSAEGKCFCSYHGVVNIVVKRKSVFSHDRSVYVGNAGTPKLKF